MINITEQQNSNILSREDRTIHAWYRFVLSYPPHLVRKYLDMFKLRKQAIVFDPFCGTGTTLVEAQMNGIRCIGADAHPFAAFVSKVKTHWSVPVEQLEQVRSEIISLVTSDLNGHKLEALSLKHILLREDFGHYTCETALSDDELKLIPSGFLSPKPLKRLLVLRRCIRRACSNAEDEIKDFFDLAFCHVVANGAGNFAFGPEIYRTKPKTDYDVLGHFAEKTRCMIYDLKTINVRAPFYKESDVICGDSRDCSFLQ
ncbi:MAG TPA: DNA methyltransferase, partial [Dissulfurispiraceae bacterium]|nr:DNA methyltransferase [Dissulfurispiraceae bacterium]